MPRYSKWAKAYGSIFSLKLGRGTLVVLSSAVDAGRIMDKRSLHYSNRPSSYVVGDLVFEGNHPMFMNADERWKLRRKLYYDMLQESRCNKEHIGLLEAESAQLVRDICLHPADLMLHPGRFSNSITMSLVFGFRTPRHSTSHYVKLQKLMEDLSALGETGATPPIDFLPALKYLPEGLWGNWKTRVRELRETISDLYTPLVERVIERRKLGKSANSLVDRVLDQQDKLQLSRSEIEIMGGNLLEGGTDTMAAIILTLFQAMAMNPHTQEEAHRQIDSAIDDTKMPSWADYERLPYVAMLVKELLRWRPPAPTAFPHATNQDDEVDGMSIPKGSTVILNIWGIHHDPNHYENPEIFDPSRFQNQTRLASVYANSGGYEKRDHFSYGIGRRICPGIHLAERALFLAIARIMWAFTIEPKLDARGEPLPIDVGPATGYHDGFLNLCVPFEVEVKPRSEKRLETILTEVAKAEEVFSAYSL
ncbi:cytochrome P450 2D18 [Xylaria cf. heliscus]|nr:cytochrome P450 2D18 [Xylaria cf. heliscus]